MKKFICEQNVAHFSKLLKDARDPPRRRRSSVARENRKLAMLDAAQVGADVTSVARQPRQPIDASKIREQFLSDFDHWPHPLPAARSGSGPGDRRRQRRLRDGDPHTAERHPGAVAVRRLSGQSGPSLCGRGKQSQQFTEDCREDRAPHAMSVQRYDTRGPAGDSWNATGNRSTRRSATPTDDSCSCRITSRT
jgi:hypothetical protein